MSDMTDPDALQPIIRTCQIIVGALIVGVMTFLAIVLFAIPPLLNPAPAFPGEGAGGAAIAAPGNSSLPVISYLAVAVGLMDLVLSFVVPRMNADRARRQMALEGPTAITRAARLNLNNSIRQATPESSPSSTRPSSSSARPCSRARPSSPPSPTCWSETRSPWRRPSSCSAPWLLDSRPRTASMPGSTASSGCSRRNGNPPFDASSFYVGQDSNPDVSDKSPE
jgi:hypothetical protein